MASQKKKSKILSVAYQITTYGPATLSFLSLLNLPCLFSKARGYVLALPLTESLLLRFLLSFLSSRRLLLKSSQMLPPQRSFSWSPYLKYNSDHFPQLILLGVFSYYMGLSEITMYGRFLILVFLLNISSKRTGVWSLSWCLVPSGVQ